MKLNDRNTAESPSGDSAGTVEVAVSSSGDSAGTGEVAVSSSGDSAGTGGVTWSLLVRLNVFMLVVFVWNANAQNLSVINPDSLYTLLQPSTPNLSKILLDIGKTNRPELQDPVINFLQTNNKLSAQTKWSAHLALARLGEGRALDYILQRVQKAGVNDDVVYELFPGLVYTRQRQAIDYLITIIKKDEKSCQSADPENPQPINCAYRVLEYLAPVIKDFPMKTDASGDLDVRDYSAALKQARSWFNVHPNYKIIID